MTTASFLIRLLAVASLVSACAARPPRAADTTPAPAANRARPPDVPGDLSTRLGELRTTRGQRGTTGDYVVGEGDLLAIEVVDLPELTRKVRVDGQGVVILPLVNAVPVGGKTVSQIQSDLTGRVKKYVHYPQVSVFVEEYRSQQIAVMGAVQRPGLISETGNHTSVLDAISAAGGMTPEAGSRLYLIPAESRAGAVGLRTASSDVDRLAGAAPVVIDTAAVGEDVQQQFFSLPVHGGDVIVVPPAGQFVADGWVTKPGTYPVTSGLTLRGAIATAGGFSFPADRAQVRIVHSGPNGANEVRTIDYDDVVAGRTPDVFIQQGDVVEVGSAKGKLVPWSFYKVMADVIRVGAGIRVGP
jgi:polysaccharide export outer membrane protein